MEPIEGILRTLRRLKVWSVDRSGLPPQAIITPYFRHREVLHRRCSKTSADLCPGDWVWTLEVPASTEQQQELHN